MPYYRAKLGGVDADGRTGVVVYPFPRNNREVTGTKYRWDVGDYGYSEAVMWHPEDLPDTEYRWKITKEEYDSFGKVTVTSDKSQIKSDGSDRAKVTVQFPEGGGEAVIRTFMPDRTQDAVRLSIPSDGKVNLPSPNLTSNVKGRIRVSVSSNKWHDTVHATRMDIDAV